MINSLDHETGDEELTDNSADVEGNVEKETDHSQMVVSRVPHGAAFAERQPPTVEEPHDSLREAFDALPDEIPLTLDQLYPLFDERERFKTRLQKTQEMHPAKDANDPVFAYDRYGIAIMDAFISHGTVSKSFKDEIEQSYGPIHESTFLNVFVAVACDMNGFIPPRTRTVVEETGTEEDGR